VISVTSAVEPVTSDTFPTSAPSLSTGASTRTPSSAPAAITTSFSFCDGGWLITRVLTLR
jgi:hypothetical protein